MVKTLIEIHEDVPADHYDRGISRNLFQKYWHWRRFSQIQNAITPVEGAFLDIGCHSGTFTEKILKKIGTKKVYGIDISSSAIKKAKSRIPFGHFEIADAANLPFEDNFFKSIVCLEVLEHVDNPDKVILEIKRVLKKGGYVLILVPADNKLFKIVWFLWTLYYQVWKHAHVQSFTGNSLENLVTKTGLKIKRSKTFNLGMLKLITAEK